jgi:acetylornithine deacetylase
MSTTKELLEKLVSFDTTSQNSNLELIDFIRGYLDGYGVLHRVAKNSSGDKACLHAVIGPGTRGGIALSGHVDTVPVIGQAWSSNPFGVRQSGGRLYGRGTCDMKGFVASCLSAVPRLVRMPLQEPVHLFVTFDEETDVSGARRLIEDIGESGWLPAVCVVDEPSDLSPVVQHKGKLNVVGEVVGISGHSSRPGQGVNAVQAASEAIAWVAREARRFAASGNREEGFEPPHTTVHVGTFAGGTALNMIPESATFWMEWRNVPADDAMFGLSRMQKFVDQELLPTMKAVSDKADFKLKVAAWYPPLSLSSDHHLVPRLQQATGSNTFGKVSYATEAGVFEQSGIPTIICGPGNIAQAHQPDEWIAEDQLDACDAMIVHLCR